MEDISTDIEIYELKLKKSDELLKQKDKEITSLKIELQSLKSHFEKEIKKLKKAQEASSVKRVGGGFVAAAHTTKTNPSALNTTIEVATGSQTANSKAKVLSSLPDTRPSLPKFNNTNNGRAKVDLNHTYVGTYDNVFEEDLNGLDEEEGKNSAKGKGESAKQKGMFKDDFFTRGVQKLRSGTQKSQLYGRTMSILGFNKESKQ